MNDHVDDETNEGDVCCPNCRSTDLAWDPSLHQAQEIEVEINGEDLVRYVGTVRLTCNACRHTWDKVFPDDAEPTTDQAMRETGSPSLFDDQLVQEIAQTLQEPAVVLIRQVVRVIGPERAREILAKTQEVESAGGMLTDKGDRRRAPGGVFFKLTKESVSGKERRAIFGTGKGKGKPKGPAVTQPKNPPSWDDVRATLDWAGSLGKKADMSIKATVIGRPKQFKKLDTCVALAIDPRKPSPLPKGLPEVPETATGTVICMVANKQWAKVAPALEEDKDDHLIIEGYPVFDSKGKVVVLALNVVSRNQQKAKFAKG